MKKEFCINSNENVSTVFDALKDANTTQIIVTISEAFQKTNPTLLGTLISAIYESPSLYQAKIQAIKTTYKESMEETVVFDHDDFQFANRKNQIWATVSIPQNHYTCLFEKIFPAHETTAKAIEAKELALAEEKAREDKQRAEEAKKEKHARDLRAELNNMPNEIQKMRAQITFFENKIKTLESRSNEIQLELEQSTSSASATILKPSL